MNSRDCPSLCGWYCCCCCIQICCPREEKKKFDGHEYKLVHTSPKEPFEKYPPFSLQKSFTLPQAKADFSFPFYSQRSAYITRKGTVTVTEQPRLSPSVGPLKKKKLFRSHSLREYPQPRSPVPHHLGRVEAERGVSASPSYPQGLVPTPSSTPAPHKHLLEASNKGAAEGTSAESAEVAPAVMFSLYYSIQVHSLTVHLEGARNLPHTKKKGYLILLYLVPHRREILELHVQESSANPHINQSLKFTGFLTDEIQSQTLVLQVYCGVTKDDLIGGITLPLRKADLYGEIGRASCRESV